MCLLQEILEKIKKTAALTVDGEQPQCYVLFILSHGNTIRGEEGPFGTDGEHLKKADILDVLKNCPNLSGVPRLVFLLCCRGGTIQVFIFLVSHSVLVCLE